MMKMKLACVYYLPAKTLPIGIFNKIQGQAKAAKKLHLDIDYFILNKLENKQLDNLKLIKINLPKNTILNFVKRYFFKFKTIDQNLDLAGYNKIILRYPLSTDLFFYKPFWQKYKNKVVTIHNTNEIEELKTNKTLLGKINLILEKRNSSKLLANIAGIIGVSNEIRKIELKKIKEVKPSIAISNGIDVGNIPFTKFTFFDNKTLNLIFISSIFYPWQGLERLLKSLNLYNGKVKIRLFLIGEINNNIEKSLIHEISNTNIDIQMLGSKYGTDIDNYFSKSTLAIGTLALFKKNMNETSALKIGEYLARGIPFIYAYNETDIEKKCEYALKFENKENIIDIKKVIEFAEKVSSNEKISFEMRRKAFNNSDWKIKVKKIYDFAENTI